LVEGWTRWTRQDANNAMSHAGVCLHTPGAAGPSFRRRERTSTRREGLRRGEAAERVNPDRRV